MADIVSWSPIDDNNNTAPPDGWPEGQMPSTVNNAARAMMGGVRRWYDTVTAQIASLTAALGNYLPLSGGSLTGALSAPLYRINGIPFADSDGVTSHIYDGTGGAGIHLLAATNYYDADTHIFRNNIGSIATAIIDPTGNLTLTGNLIHFGGSSGTANTTGGPLIYADVVNHVYKQGSGNGSFLFQNYAGGNVASINAGGGISAASLSVTGAITAAGNVTAPAFIGNVTVPAGGPISTSGTVTGGTVTSTGNMTAAGTVTAAQLTATAHITAAGTVTATQLTATADINAGGTVTAAGNISAGGDVYAATLRGGNGVDCGVLRTAPTADPARHTMAFGWNSTDPTLDIVIDNSFTGLVPWSQVIKTIEVQADGGAPAGWHLAAFSGGLITYYYSDIASDARLKRGIADSEIDALAALEAVPIRRYEWQDEVQPLFGVRQAPVAIGLVAQDLLPTMSDCVGISEGREAPYPADTHVIKHDRIDAYTIRAIQQLSERNATLEARVAALEHRGGG